jgi:hypothetical protein
MPLRAWGVTRQNLVTLNNALAIIQTIRNEMALDAPYAGNVANIDAALSTLNSIAQQVADHLTAEGK